MDESLISKRNSLILKGVGILLMFIHHLFYSPWSQPLYDDITIHGVGIVNQIGVFCKLCVAVFVFVSGYGLAVSTPKDIKLIDFYCHRLKKLYLNYWYIWLIFVPISVFVFGRSFADAYGNHAVVKAILEFFGFAKMFGIMGYNATWWFYNCIIILYLIFPLIYRYYLRVPYLLISISVTIVFFKYIELPGFDVFSDYLLVFVLGMFLSKMPVIWISSLKVRHIVVAICLLSIYRMTKISPNHITDSLLCVGMAFLLFKIRLNNWFGKVLEELGRHSMNMFLIHTFICYYWFSEYIYITRNPLFIFLSLFLSSYIVSYIIEWSKKVVRFNKMLK